MTDTVLVGRQPIFNRDLEIVAYELLFRSGPEESSADFTDGDHATSRVIDNTFRGIGLENLVGSLPAYINLTRSFLLGELQLPLRKEQIVLEVLEDIEINEELLRCLRALSQDGYTIALDDFAYDPRYKELIDIADIVKIDLSTLDEATLREHVRRLREHDVKLLAEKVETRDQLEICHNLGFDYYQGYFLAEPNNVIMPRP